MAIPTSVFVDAVSGGVARFVREHPQAVQTVHDQADLDRLVADMLAPLRYRAIQEEMTAEIGPYYDAAALARRWGVTRQAVAKRRSHGTLLGILADDGKILYPVWQFMPGSDAHPTPVAGIAQVRRVLSERNPDPLSHAIWLTSPSFARIEGRPVGTPAYRWLAEGRELEFVLEAARTHVARLAS